MRSFFVLENLAANSHESNSEKVQVDAILNHALGVMLLHHHFVERDIPAYAYEQAQSLNWVV